MKQAEKNFLRAVKDADRAFYLRAADMAADAQKLKRTRRFYAVMKHILKWIAAGGAVLAAVLGVCMFTGVIAKKPAEPITQAGSSGQPSQFVDPEQFEQRRNQQLDVHFTDFTADDHAASLMNSALTVNQQYLYCSGFDDSFRIDLQTGAAEYLCAVPGCLHGVNDAGCEMYRRNRQLLGTDNGVIQASGWYFRAYSEDWLHGDRSETLFWVNEFFTELDKTMNPSSPRATGIIRYFDGQYYMQTTNSFTRIDPASGESSAQVISDSQIFSVDGSGGEFWFTNEGLELMHWDTKTGKTEKLADRIAACACNAQYVFYDRITEATNGKTVRRLMRRDRDGQNETCIIEDFQCMNARFAVTEQSIYYYQDGAYENGQYHFGKLLRCDLDGGNLHEIPLDLIHTDGKPHSETAQTGISMLNCKSCNTIFLLDAAPANEGCVERDALFLIKKDTDEVQAVDLGIAQYGERRSW